MKFKEKPKTNCTAERRDLSLLTTLLGLTAQLGASTFCTALQVLASIPNPHDVFFAQCQNSKNEFIYCRKWRCCQPLSSCHFKKKSEMSWDISNTCAMTTLCKRSHMSSI